MDVPFLIFLHAQATKLTINVAIFVSALWLTSVIEAFKVVHASLKNNSTPDKGCLPNVIQTSL